MAMLHRAACTFFCIFLATSSFCRAEILHNVYPLDDLRDIKQKYPNALFTRVRAAWVTEGEAFFKMTGQGFVGALYLAFSDGRPSAKQYLENNCRTDSTAPARTEAVETLCQLNKKWAERSEDEALSINWVRWAPDQPIPFERYRSRYGEPTQIDFDSNTMVPQAYWKAVDLRANLSDDKKFVLTVETTFTNSEVRQAWLRRFGFIPESLKPSPEDSPVKEPARPGNLAPQKKTK
jgi:hypothetical protein